MYLCLNGFTDADIVGEVNSRRPAFIKRLGEHIETN